MQQNTGIAQKNPKNQDIQQPNSAKEAKEENEEDEEDEDEVFRQKCANLQQKLQRQWLQKTNSMLQKFNNTYDKIKIQQKGLQQGFKLFAENQNKFQLSSMKKINCSLDKKQLYDQYIAKTRKTIQKISPLLMLNILAYTDSHVFLVLLRMRKVSKIFYSIFTNQAIQQYLAEKDYLFSGYPNLALKSSLTYCKKYISFYRTFMYYKQMHYCQQIPQNSIMKDFQDAVNFINQIHKLVIEKKSRSFTYFKLVNCFMKKHRVIMGLSSLSLSLLAMVRKAAIVAFSNYLAFNKSQRSKQQITKTKYLKVISVVQNQKYRQSLLINTKVSNFLLDNYNISFAVLVTNNKINLQKIVLVKTWNILIYHTHDEDKAVFLEDVELQSNKLQESKFELQFSQNMSNCTLSTVQYLNRVKMQGEGQLMDTIIQTNKNKVERQQLIQKISKEHNQVQIFSFCYFYKLQQYYVIAIPNKFQ